MAIIKITNKMKSVKTVDPQKFFSYIAGESINSYNHTAKLFGISFY